jgi:Cof subfamily protein (haloacid dehalogenase superfamily)
MPRRCVGNSPTRSSRSKGVSLLVAIDLDGILLRSDGTLSPRTVTSLRDAQENGASIVLASGRHPESVEKLRGALGLTGALIAYNGALCYQPEDGRIFNEATLTPADAKMAIAIGQAADLHVSLFVGRRWMIAGWDAVARRESAATKVEPEVVGELSAEAAAGAHKVLLIGPPQLLLDAAERIARHCPAAYAVRSLPEYLEIVPAGPSKGEALRLLAEQQGVARARIVAIGDGENDIALFDAAGYAVAMGNASLTVQANADAIAPTNDMDGVAWFLDHLHV